ncbi:uncharacterized protein EI90DRAFT_1299010 [Cantharellus anzutake]|uniref:uncharacterized protein n=1 Tax=Cantharellus anzutake TaxID=1750568 RepID=UPI001905217D|nr:uncharacterized protein EI90DRAFT_1299010 [Cantharellus anzutake]KAF8342047.1 hypothetical protein EI90DRAFT_1299010 [Cantharellus anzutake]
MKLPIDNIPRGPFPLSFPFSRNGLLPFGSHPPDGVVEDWRPFSESHYLITRAQPNSHTGALQIFRQGVEGPTKKKKSLSAVYALKHASPLTPRYISLFRPMVASEGAPGLAAEVWTLCEYSFNARYTDLQLILLLILREPLYTCPIMSQSGGIMNCIR